jgi:hypothetical protein
VPFFKKKAAAASKSLGEVLPEMQRCRPLAWLRSLVCGLFLPFRHCFRMRVRRCDAVCRALATSAYIDRQLSTLPAEIASGAVDLSSVPARDRYRIRQQCNLAKIRLTEKKLTLEELDGQRTALISAIQAALAVEERAREKVAMMGEVCRAYLN